MLQKALSIVAVASLLALAGCEAVKSENPLSPSVAGPIPGVSITAPKPLEPASGAELDKDQQPVTLLIENASSTGVRPLAYVVEVATDSGFANKVFSREGVPPGGPGRTRVRLDVLSPDRTYLWRARAQDGANTGPFSEAASFRIAPPAALDAPPLIAPVGGVTHAALPPVLVFGQAPRVGLVGSVSYRIQVASDSAFGAIFASATVGEQGGQTSFSLPGSFPTGSARAGRGDGAGRSRALPACRRRRPAAPSASRRRRRSRGRGRPARAPLRRGSARERPDRAGSAARGTSSR